MPPRAHSTGLLAAALFVAAIASAQDTSRDPANATQAACAAAQREANFGDLAIPAETQALLESYRADWRRLCATTATGERVRMAGILEKAKALEAGFAEVFAAFNRGNRDLPSDAGWERARQAHELIAKQYPTFVPAFEGSLIDWEYFRPSSVSLRDVFTVLGGAEDRLFIASEIPIETRPAPWIEMTWDYGGCERFGDFPWIATLETVVRLQGELTSETYLRLTEDFRRRLLGSDSPLVDSSDPNICTCGAKEAVVADLRNVSDYLRDNPALAGDLAAIVAKIAAVESGRVTVSSERERHCSGG